MFIGENLSNLRIMHGYSRKQLSEMINISEQAVWQYENNITSPKLQTVNDLKKIFKVKSKYFYNPDILSKYLTTSNVNVTNIAYRSKFINVISKTQSEVKHIEYLDTFVGYITKQVRYPSLKIIQLRDKIVEYIQTNNDDKLTQINYVATFAREYLGFDNGTNDNLMFLIEKSGVFIFEKALGEDIDAYSLWTKNNSPYIILGNMKRSAVRRNFDIAHELGHLLLHYQYEFTNFNKKEHKEIEKEADLFASAFLLPEVEFTKDMNNIFHVTNPDAYLDLKKKWGTSLQAIGYRASNLQIIEPKSHRNFYVALHRKGYLKIEPLDTELPIQKPMRIKSIIDLIAKNNLIDIQEMIENDWNTDIEFFYKLTGIDTSFFKKYYPQSTNFELGSIIDIPFTQ